MAISSYKVYLMGEGANSAWAKLVNVKDYPDLGGAPEMLDTTTLSDKNRTYIPGIQENESMTFTANYTKDDFDKLYALRGKLCGYAVWFGATESNGTVTPDGHEGKYAFGGYLDVFVNGAGVNEVVNMTITIAPATELAVDGNIDWSSVTEEHEAITP